MYEPQLCIDPAVYCLLVRWGLSTGYQIKTNEPHDLLYDIVCKDQAFRKGLSEKEEGNDTRLSRVKAEDLVNFLNTQTRHGRDQFDPAYSPPVRLDEDMFDDYFMPYMVAERPHYKVSARHEGIFWYVDKVSNGDPLSCVMCRSDVAEIVRDLEFDRRMPQFIVKYQHGSTVKTWEKGVDSFAAAASILEREKPRHVPTADWRIYQEMTALLRHTEDLPEDALTPDGWLWMRVWHPGQCGADYWFHGFYDNLEDERIDMIQEEAMDMYAVTGIYACLRHDPPPEKDAAPASKWHLLSTVSKPGDTQEELAGGFAVLWASKRDKGHDAIWVMVTPDPHDVDEASIAMLKKAMRTTAELPDFDHALLYPVYKGLKCEDGVNSERYFGEDSSYVNTDQ